MNCATLRGDGAMSTLFGHGKGAFTGAVADRPGLLRAADGGMLFLDEIGELGLDEQAMILRAIEEKRFLPVGADKEASATSSSSPAPIAISAEAVGERHASATTSARLNLWTFALPGLAERREDIEPNLDYELDRFAEREGERVTFNQEARQRYLAFATSPEARWPGNFRDLAAASPAWRRSRPRGRIDVECVDEEIARLRRLWARAARGRWRTSLATSARRRRRAAAIDLFDRVQLAEMIRVCRRAARCPRPAAPCSPPRARGAAPTTPTGCANTWRGSGWTGRGSAPAEDQRVP